MDDVVIANEAQINYWNHRGGASWVPAQERTDAMLGPFGEAALDAADIRPGHRVLDVGCGCGDTTLSAADRVGEAGHVVGLDVSAPMLAHARTRAAGRDNVVFVTADAQTADVQSLSVDRVVSRFGVMFFDDPVAAFTNIGAAVVPGGRLSFVCWKGADANPWMGFAVRAVDHLLDFPAPTPGGPGPFSLADPDTVGATLTTAGFSDVGVEPFDGVLDIVGGVDVPEAVDNAIEMSPLPGLVADDEELAARVREAIGAAFVGAWDRGGVHLPYGAWIVTATR